MARYWIAGLVLVTAGIAWYACFGFRCPCSGRDDGKPDRPASVAPPSSPPDAASPSKAAGSSAGAAAIRRASEAGSHLFLFVYQGNSPETREARDRFEAAVARIGPSVQWMVMDRENPSEKDVIARLELELASTPVVLALAPNGAITGGIRPEELTEEKLRDSIASPILQKCLKSLQEGRLVFLCVRDKSTPSTDPSWQGVNEFKEDERFKCYTDIVQVDPTDNAEKKLLQDLQIDPHSTLPTTVLFMPPRTVAANVMGPTNKSDFVRALRPPSSGG